jgi:hypothetical protein
MRNRKRQNSPVERLRIAIDCLPVATRNAMLDGVTGAERIIAGAYTDGRGGICPMLAAHRRGGRTDFISFAKSWDRFTRAKGGSRPATERELRILVTQLRASLHEADGLELDRAIADHRHLIAEGIRRSSRERLADLQRPADAHDLPADAHDPAGEIRTRRLRRGARASAAAEAAPQPRRTVQPA